MLRLRAVIFFNLVLLGSDAEVRGKASFRKNDGMAPTPVDSKSKIYAADGDLIIESNSDPS